MVRVKLLLGVPVVILFGASLSAPVAFAEDDPVTKELKALQGKWEVVYGTGKDAFAVVLIVSGDGSFKYTRTLLDGGEEGKVTFIGTVTVDPTKKPRTMDLVGKQSLENDKPDDTTELCIYELKGDQLKLTRGAGEYPTKFTKDADTDTFKRVKK